MSTPSETPVGHVFYEKRFLQVDSIKEFHRILKTGTADTFDGLSRTAQKTYFNVGDRKQLAHEVGERETCKPADVAREMQALNKWYLTKET